MINKNELPDELVWLDFSARCTYCTRTAKWALHTPCCGSVALYCARHKRTAMKAALQLLASPRRMRCLECGTVQHSIARWVMSSRWATLRGSVAS